MNSSTKIILFTTSAGAMAIGLVWRFMKSRNIQKQKSNIPSKESKQGIDLSEPDYQKEEEDLAELEHRRDFIKDMAREAWQAYCKYAWGQDVLVPGARGSFNFQFGPCSGHSLITGMSTLWIMGLDSEFRHARRWLENRFELPKMNQQWDVRETCSEYLGSLLACYCLSEDSLFLERAVEIADMLEPAYRTKSGIPYRSVNPKKGIVKLSQSTYLSDIWAGACEYPLLSDLTGNPVYRNRIDTILALFASKSAAVPNGLYLKWVSIETGEWTFGAHEHENLNSCGSFQSSLGRYWREHPLALIKSYVQRGRKDADILEQYKKVMDGLVLNGLFGYSSTGSMFPRAFYDFYTRKHANYSEYPTFYVPGMLALAGQELKLFYLANSQTMTPDEEQTEWERLEQHWQFARDCTETLAEESKRTVTGLPPWRIYFGDDNDQDGSKKKKDYHYQGFNLGPELAETYFLMYRMTRDPKYRDYAWSLAQAIHAHCRISPYGGYSEIDSVHIATPTAFSNLPKILRAEHEHHTQPAHFLGATLKYLYLIFTDADEVLPVERWVFNSAGQPLPIRGCYPIVPSPKQEPKNKGTWWWASGAGSVIA